MSVVKMSWNAAKQLSVTTPVTYAELPTVNVPVGSTAFITDSFAAIGSIGDTVAGGGTGKVPVYYDGSAWLLG